MRHQTGNMRVALAPARGNAPFPLGLCIVTILGASGTIYWLLFAGATQVSRLF
jgi:hypothetical protein